MQFFSFRPLQCTFRSLKNIALRAAHTVGHLPWVPPPRVSNPQQDPTLLYFICSICCSILYTNIIVSGPGPQHWKTRVFVEADQRLKVSHTGLANLTIRGAVHTVTATAYQEHTAKSVMWCCSLHHQAVSYLQIKRALKTMVSDFHYFLHTL